MADITITAGDVQAGSSARTTTGTAGETITAGQPVYLDSSTQRYKRALHTGSTTAVAVGIALHGAANGQPLSIQTAGAITLSAVMTAGEIYAVSANAGGIAPCGDLGAGDYTTVLGVAESTSSLVLGIVVGGVAHG